ncbi:SRPBCC domain-containing protein [Mucilaginibacter sp. 21P]|uniref:SRPBCC family protein n=1 Tax=Mucilaginibacter sp. 21P TaxID=2778902 RepID=UPI001C58B486|nr:SRPBCC domain-containing protein [Mucilaginibacter sp. 21P]QXV64020.1 SRPBCC domain-containing protein [Mucilaginibacter sp. 21P]
MERNIKIKWYFPYSVEKVWECLTDPSLLDTWLVKNDFKPVVGHQFNFFTKPLPKMDFDGIIYCEVLEVLPLKRLVYTWKGCPAPGVIKLDTILCWTIIPREDGTEVILEHKGFKGFGNVLSSIFMGNSWRKRIRQRFELTLKELIEKTSIKN